MKNHNFNFMGKSQETEPDTNRTITALSEKHLRCWFPCRSWM